MRYYVPPYSRVNKKGNREDVDGYWRNGKPGDGGPGLPAGSKGIPAAAYETKKAKPGSFQHPVRAVDAPPAFPHSAYLTRKDFSDPETPRSDEVTPEEFRNIHADGKARYAKLTRHGSTPTALLKNWDQIKSDAYESVQSEWGGVTIDTHTGRNATSGYAFTIKDPGQHSVSIPIGSSRADFDTAMAQARQTFGRQLAIQEAHLGVFRDDKKGTIDIDPTLVVPELSDAETIGAYTRAVGGAYHFEDGDGYWPPHIKEGADLAEKEDALPGNRRVALAERGGESGLVALAAPRPGSRRPAQVRGGPAAGTGPGRAPDVEAAGQAVERYLSMLG